MHTRSIVVQMAAVLTLSGAACSRQPADQKAQPASTPTQPATPEAPPPLDWKALEAPVLTRHVQLTTPRLFPRAGEAYFDPMGRWIIFQAIPMPRAGRGDWPWYLMYLARLKLDDAGVVVGLNAPKLLSTSESANTCGYFHPLVKGRVSFSTTTRPPAEPKKDQAFNVKDRYVWQFPDEMEVVTRIDPDLWADQSGMKRMPDDVTTGVKNEVRGPQPLFERPGYDAEASWSKDGRYVIYTQTRDNEGKTDADIWLFDSFHRKSYPVIVADGYDGGPFFSPDGTMICYRSDRNQNDLLQIYVARLKFKEGGFFDVIEGEYPLTQNEHVNWCPFWHPSGDFLVYATSELGHRNYEVFAVEVDTAKGPAELKRARVTQADGADVLPAFSDDGRWMMWTSQRGGKEPGAEKPSSQLWIAAFDPAGLSWQ